MSDIVALTKNFGDLYRQVASASKAKDAAQKAMFQAFTELESNQLLSERIVSYDDPTLEPEAFIDTYFPGWKLVNVDKNQEKLLIQEDPALKKSTFINPVDGYVYGRNTRSSGPQFNDVALKEENPKLWYELTEWPEPWFSLCLEFAASFGADQELGGKNALIDCLDDWFAEAGIERSFKSPDQWTEEQTKEAEAYWLPGRISTVLAPPRLATPEELENL